MNFELNRKFEPKGDQPKAISELVEGIKSGHKYQTLLGVTGSGKTFTMANVIKEINKPTLVIAPNKTLAAQLCAEFRDFFPKNAVEFFVSYYDYYQPEAYLPTSDTFIEKEATINNEIERLRHAATAALLSRKDVIIVASVSCIYGLGSPVEYEQTVLNLSKGKSITRDEIISKLIEMLFVRNDTALVRGTFRAKGEIIEIMPTNIETIIRVELQNNTIDKIFEVDPATRHEFPEISYITIFPAKHFITTPAQMEKSLKEIEKEMIERVKYFKNSGKHLEAQRIEQRTKFDIEMLRNIGYCNGIENYSRIIAGRPPGSAPATLLDYFPKDFFMIIDESHITVPQINGMYNGDRSRKETLVEHGFRLPSALDNRPLKFDEFEKKIKQCIFTSATPAEYEARYSSKTVEQIIRPTGLVDPEIEVRPTKNQIDDVLNEIRKREIKKERVLITTLTKSLAEDIAEFLTEAGVKVRYIHSEVDTLERLEILAGLRKGQYDVLVGINLLREGLDLPEVSLVAILDADKEGFLRSARSLTQTIGRAARNAAGKVILYGDTVTDSMKKATDETNRRREIQQAYNKKNHITPATIKKEIYSIYEKREEIVEEAEEIILDLEEIPEVVKQKTKAMKEAAEKLDFESAARIRDEIKKLKKLSF